MGVPGLWRELSPAAKTKALCNIALQHWEKSGSTLRIAIDAPIWLFQIQTGQEEDSCSQLKTWFYRLCRLLEYNIFPVFVFDGNHKPSLKRNRHSAKAVPNNGDVKHLIRAFGFIHWDAPGEAEAECALLQRMGLVDLIMSEDVDSLVFGASCVLREVPSTGNQKKTHVVVYEDVYRKTGLDKDGLVLCAMLSGGDYMTEGVHNCGPTLALEIARAGYATSLMKSTDHASWRSSLAEAVCSNSNKLFSRKHPTFAKNLQASSFPNPKILRNYTHPVVSSATNIREFRPDWRKPDMKKLAQLCKELFNWNFHEGMAKFMGFMVPGVLLWELINTTTTITNPPPTAANVPRVTENPGPTKPPANSLKHPGEESIIAWKDIRIHRSRKNISTDYLPELQISYLPAKVVPDVHLIFDIDIEPLSPKISVTTAADVHSKSEDLGLNEWSPDMEQKMWILRAYLNMRWPRIVKEWETREAKRKGGGMMRGAIEPFLVSRTSEANSDHATDDSHPSRPHIPQHYVSADDAFNGKMNEGPIFDTDTPQAPSRKRKMQSPRDPFGDVQANVIKFECLWTRHILQKSKWWNDGRLDFNVSNKKALVYVDETCIGEDFLTNTTVATGEVFNLDKIRVTVKERLTPLCQPTLAEPGTAVAGSSPLQRRTRLGLSRQMDSPVNKQFVPPSRVKMARCDRRGSFGR